MCYNRCKAIIAKGLIIITFTHLIIIVCLLLLFLYLGISYFLAKLIALPKTLNYEEEIAYEKRNQLWGQYDLYPKNDYLINGERPYALLMTHIPAPNASSRYVIISHGYTSNRYGAVKYLDAYRQLGFNVLIYDIRGHGQNDRMPVSLGYFESDDLLAIIEDSYQRYGQDIYLGLHGESMGSAISISVLDRTQKLAFVVADCGFSSLKDLLRDLYRQRHALFFLPGANLMTRLFFGYWINQSHPIEALKNNYVPLLFIHGKNDRLIPPSHSLAMAKASQGYVEVQLIEGAVHAGSRHKLGQASYSKMIATFLDNIKTTSPF